jgi:hypothetical protein
MNRIKSRKEEMLENKLQINKIFSNTEEHYG